MSDGNKPPAGQIGWVDLTVQDADGLREFYESVVGWQSSPVDMGEYNDFNMLPPGSDQPTAGICNKVESNADLPSCWMVYITVDDVHASAERCKALGGEVLVEPRGTQATYCVIKDPAGAVCALFQTQAE